MHCPPLGLYLHIPFCAAICNYCNFNRSLFDGALKTRYVEALIAEITRAGAGRWGGSGRSGRSGRVEAGREAADTIYFGGGTPSLLEPAEVRRLIDGCLDAFDVSRERAK